METVFLLLFVTSLMTFSGSASVDDSGADIGFYPQNREPLEGVTGQRRIPLSSLLELSSDFPQGGRERSSMDRRLLMGALEAPLWNRMLSKVLKDTSVENQDSNLTRRKRYCCSLDMYCFLCYR